MVAQRACAFPGGALSPSLSLSLSLTHARARARTHTHHRKTFARARALHSLFSRAGDYSTAYSIGTAHTGTAFSTGAASTILAQYRILAQLPGWYVEPGAVTGARARIFSTDQTGQNFSRPPPSPLGCVYACVCVCLCARARVVPSGSNRSNISLSATTESHPRVIQVIRVIRVPDSETPPPGRADTSSSEPLVTAVSGPAGASGDTHGSAKAWGSPANLLNQPRC